MRIVDSLSACWIKCVCPQNDFSLVDRAFERETAEACYHYGVKMSSYGPLAGGMLSGKYTEDGNDLSKARHTLFPTFQQRYHLDRTKDAARKYAGIARKYGLTPSQLALAWQRTRWYIDSVIIGATSMEQLEDNIQPFAKVLLDVSFCLLEVYSRIALLYSGSPLVRNAGYQVERRVFEGD